MIELSSCDFFFVAHKASDTALAAIIVTAEQEHLERSTNSCIANIAKYINGDVNVCARRLRTIHAHNARRIAETTASTTEEDVASGRVTPSPRLEEEVPSEEVPNVDVPDEEAPAEEANQDTSNTQGSQRKRRHDEISDES